MNCGYKLKANGDKAAAGMLLAGGGRLEVKGGKTPGDAEPDSWDESCFCVCQRAAEEEACICWWRRSFSTCFNLITEHTN